MTLAERLAHIQDEMAPYLKDRDITLIAVSKYATVEQLVEAFNAGIRHFGENKVQDALDKMAALPSVIQSQIQWHFIGHLQSNKVNKTLSHFAWIHSIDSVALAQSVSTANERSGSYQNVLLQVNSTVDETRHGFLPSQLPTALGQLRLLPGINIHGLMTMAPAEASKAGDSEALKQVFTNLRALRDELTAEFAIDLPELSMGMSQDYVQALQCGATMIRIGNYLFKN